MATVRIETDVELDVSLMATAFAHMNSEDQARFFALAHQQMATYSREESDGSRFKMGSYGREMQMLSIKDSFDKQPDAREFIQVLYQMTIEEDDEVQAPLMPFQKTAGEVMEAACLPKVAAETSMGTSWDNAPGNIMEDLRKAKAAMAAEPYPYLNSLLPVDDKVAAAKRSIPLHSVGESTLVSGEIECHCIQPTGVWYEIGDRALVHRTRTDEDRCGTVTKVWPDGRPDVRLDAKLTATYITVKADTLDIIGSLAYTKSADGISGSYIGRVTDRCSNGTVTIEVAPRVRPYAPDQKLPIDVISSTDRYADAGVLDFLDQNKKAVRDLLTADDPVSTSEGGLTKECREFYEGKGLLSKSPIDDTAPNVTERGQCDECKGTGTWINPANAEESPCSRGCKS